MKVLFVSSEVFPLMKTGGLADVSGSLPAALSALGHDVRILMPAYPEAVAAAETSAELSLRQAGSHLTLLSTRLPGTAVPLLLLDAPASFGRLGNPYLAPNGAPWPDNAERFALLARVAVDLTQDRLGLGWKPDVVHCNDWQTGLIPPLLSDEPNRPAVVFTVHNLAYQGLFPHDTFQRLALPPRLWRMEALEFYGQLSFIKGGLVFADRINTVSPSYAEEIQTPEFGCGLDGLLRSRRSCLSGILNGIDDVAWNPATDPYLPATYGPDTLERKRANRTALRQRFGMPDDPDVAVMGLVGRMVEQKGIDLLIDILDDLLHLPIQLVVLGNGNKEFECSFERAAAACPERIAATIGYDEPLAHLIEAGAEIFLMPSRFEPCGLNQLYSQRYGTVPIVRKVGGLADTVEDATPERIAAGQASGIVFEPAKPAFLLEAVYRALALYREPEVWRTICKCGMGKDFSWRKSASQYVELYREALADLNAGRSVAGPRCAA
ncbi:glycogen synthase GlgA [Methylococcus sp. ANG]|uniref:glycogen synthase GlgA n=1 Tax=Methylococcus sp. ANG TaxID=3231903 RepID=UPI00345A9CEF